MLLALTVLLFPIALMGLPLGMGMLEHRVSLEGLHTGLTVALDHHDPDLVEAYVTKGFGPAVDSYWSRQGARR